MTNRSNFITFFFSFALGISCAEKKGNEFSNEQSQDFPNYDYRLFQRTPVWELAKAVEKEDTAAIRNVIAQSAIDVNYREEKFGNTLLILCVMNRHYHSAKKLLENKADPGVRNRNGITALIEACEIDDATSGNNTRFIKLLIDYAADVNQVQSDDSLASEIQKSPLLAACGDLSHRVSPLPKVQLLVEAGANINYQDKFGHFPIGQALLNKHYDVVQYLIEKGGDHDIVVIDRSKFQKDGKKLYIADVLREHLLPLDSEKHKEKMRLVSALKALGVNYETTPVPDFILKKIKGDYPTNWEEYLKKY